MRSGPLPSLEVLVLAGDVGVPPRQRRPPAPGAGPSPRGPPRISGLAWPMSSPPSPALVIVPSARLPTSSEAPSRKVRRESMVACSFGGRVGIYETIFPADGMSSKEDSRTRRSVSGRGLPTVDVFGRHPARGGGRRPPPRASRRWPSAGPSSVRAGPGRSDGCRADRRSQTSWGSSTQRANWHSQRRLAFDGRATITQTPNLQRRIDGRREAIR